MMATHDPRHDEMLQAVLLGDCDPDSPAAKELQACEICGAELRELLATTAELDGAGREQRGVMAAAAREADGSAARDLVARAVRAGLLQRPRAARRLPWQWLALAAALLVGLLVWSQLPGDGGAGGPRDQLMGGQHELWPPAQAEVTVAELEVQPLSWLGSAGGEYHLTLWAAEDPFTMIVDEVVTGTSYRLPPDVLARLRAGGKQYLWRYERKTPAAGEAAGEQGFSLR